jgi:phage/plasmid-like protein (TIGR03299 family)
VEKQPIYLANNTLVPGKVATVRTDTSEVLGIVSKNYEIYQNTDAFDFIGNIENIKFVKAGQTRTGMIYIIGQLPSTTVLGDTFAPYVIFQTSHNGVYTVKATICPLRIVCQNQFAMSFRDSSNTISIQHSSRLPQKIAQAQQLLNDTAVYMGSFTNTAEELALLKVGDKANVNQIINAFFKSTKEITERQQEAINRQKAAILEAYDYNDNANFQGTAWGLVNAFTDFATHRERKKTKNANESTFMSVTFDTRTLGRFIECIKDVAV